MDGWLEGHEMGRAISNMLEGANPNASMPERTRKGFQ
jgi:hypothetical protein